MTERREKARDLEQRLRDVEQSALDPVIPGQVRGWCQQVRAAAEDANGPIDARCEDLAGAIANIEEADLSLLPRAERLDARMGQLCADWQRLVETLREQVRREVDLGDSDEPFDAVEGLQDELLHWIIGWRKLDAAVTGWRLESETRERGVVD